ncbi:MAG: hypothetical protein AAGG46_04435 [Planctomycetota bacterium]
MPVKRTRTKTCDRCDKAAGTLYRVRVEADGPWVFVCRECLEAVRPGNAAYQYGGTWKSKKRH